MAIHGSKKIGDLTVEWERDRIRVRDREGRLIRRRSTQGAILTALVTARSRIAALPTGANRLYVACAPEGDIGDASVEQRIRAIRVVKERILVVGRDKARLFRARPLSKRLDIRTEGAIDLSQLVVSWPVAVVPAHREVHVVSLAREISRRETTSGAIGAVRIHMGKVVVVERDRIFVMDGKGPGSPRRLRTTQKLRAETLVTKKSIAAVLTRDTVVIGDLEAERLVQVRLSNRTEKVSIGSNEVITVTTRDGDERFDKRGRRL